MWHLFSDAKPWFRPKRFGYGSGLPITWQGWVLMLSYAAAIVGLALLAEGARGSALAGVVPLILGLTAVVVLIVKARTEGAWRWRWGDDQ